MDLAKACQAARILNSRLPRTNDVEALVARVEAPRTPFRDYIKRYQEVILPARRNRKGRGLSAKTTSDYARQLREVDRVLGPLDIGRITRRVIAEFLDGRPPVYRNRLRSLLHGLFAHAVAEGVVEANPVDGTLKSVEIVARPRLTLEQFNAVRDASEPWFQRAMDLALRTLQRREDLSRMTYEHVTDGVLHVTQHKTGMRLRIQLDAATLQLIGDRTTGYLIEKNGKHVSPEMLTRAFAQARSDDLRATFHEIRALGARLLRDRGVDPQPLLGHVDPQMTRQYLDRHEVRWVEVTL